MSTSLETFPAILADMKHRMDGAIAALHHEFGALRTGRASSSLLDKVMVDAYGSTMPINQVATVSVPDATTIQIKPYDKSVIGAIEKGISRSDIGLTPNNDGQIIRLNIPPLTRERREDLVKVARHEAENTRVAVRNVRRDANDHVKKAKQAGLLTEDLEKDAHAEIQKVTDHYMEIIDADLKKKEGEIME